MNRMFKICVSLVAVALISNVSFARDKSKSGKKNDNGKEITSPDHAARPAGINDAKMIFKDDLPSGGFFYVYGGKTNYKVQSVKSPGNKSILVCNLDNSDFCGVTLALGPGKSIDLAALRNERKTAALAFWAKGKPGVKQIYVGFIDDESDNAKVQTKIVLGDWGELDTTWKYFMIPLRKFGDAGKYWDDGKKSEVDGNVKWDKISEIRFSNGKNENKVASGEPVTLYVDHVTIIDSMPSSSDAKDSKASFKSDAPDVMLHDLESPIDQKWTGNPGPKSEVKYEIVNSDASNGGKSALKVTFKMNDWCDMLYRYTDNNRSSSLRDWSKHWGIKFDMYSPKGFQPLNLQVNDSGDELFIASCGGQRGWTEVLVAFKDFYKFPYYQPPQAVQNGKFDLNNVIAIDFKPSGEGTTGWFIIDNVRLTNDREAKAAAIAENVDLTLRGDFAKVITQSINPGIFGVNVALWDSDLLEPATSKWVKDVNHSILRYPGGLRADDDHWKDVLDKKDGLVDADEAMEFAEKTNNSLMVTVNFGSGTPQEAAAWVKHYNIDQKKNVRYWEIGNELYGDWHNFHCSADDYGKRSVEFIKAMKAVDPKIKCAVVWVLDGEWNKKVFEYVKNYADGIIIHHYPQHTGEENDAGLLGAPQSLNEIIPGVRKQIKTYGVSGKHYQIWLTEWNSVDFKPGPQTLGLVNGLFVADYLGMLAVHNIEHADYWDVHNNLTAQGGDYGYLSRTGAPDGDNVPRASYWAFRMARESLRGKLVESKSADEFVTTYLSNNNGKKSLMIVNKYPKTKANITLSIPGFKGAATISQLVESNKAQGPSVEQIEVKEGMKLTVPSYSITTILLK
ncbi:MAG: carbohydrate binding domain-containing protein [Fibrobacterota bacterium]